MQMDAELCACSRGKSAPRSLPQSISPLNSCTITPPTPSILQPAHGSLHLYSTISLCNPPRPLGQTVIFNIKLAL